MGDFDLAFLEVDNLHASSNNIVFDEYDSADESSSHEHKKHHKHHHHKHHHRHHHHHSEDESLNLQEQELRKIEIENKAVSLIKESITSGDVVKLGRILDLGISINGHDFLLHASKDQNVSFEVVKLLIDEQVSLDSDTIRNSDILRNFIFNGRDDLLRLAHKEYNLNFEDDNSTSTLSRDLASLKMLEAKKIDMITTLYELGYKFPPTDEGVSFSKLLKSAGFENEIVKHAKDIEKKAKNGTSWLKKVFKG